MMDNFLSTHPRVEPRAVIYSGFDLGASFSLASHESLSDGVEDCMDKPLPKQGTTTVDMIKNNPTMDKLYSTVIVPCFGGGWLMQSSKPSERLSWLS